MRPMRGFTLLEILVALTVLALAMGALVEAASRFTLNQAYLRDRTLATWVARNRLVEQQLDPAWPKPGQTKGEVELGGREWRWVMQVTQTPERDLRRLDIEVFALPESDDERPLATLAGLVEKR